MTEPNWTPPINPAQPAQPAQPQPYYVPSPPPKKRHTVRNVLLIAVAAFVALCGVGTVVAAATGGGKPAAEPSHQSVFTDCPFAAGGCPKSASPGVVAATGVPVKCADGVISNTGLPNYCADHGGVAPTAAATTKAAPTTPAAPKLTLSQQQALVMAREYLATQAFSRTGLIKQLQYEGFSVADATYGVDAVGADWTAQADKMAKEYLSTQAFSHSGLVKQLEYEGFTAAQAEHGVAAAGL